MESRTVFYFRYAREICYKHVRFALMYWQYRRILKRALRSTADATDIAMTPVQDDEFQTLEIYTATPAARVAVDRLHRYKRTQTVSGD